MLLYFILSQFIVVYMIQSYCILFYLYALTHLFFLTSFPSPSSLHHFILSLFSQYIIPSTATSSFTRSPQATVLDACLDKGRGIIADVLVQWGELSVGDAVVIGTSFGRVKSMEDHLVRVDEVNSKSIQTKYILDSARCCFSVAYLTVCSFSFSSLHNFPSCLLSPLPSLLVKLFLPSLFFSASLLSSFCFLPSCHILFLYFYPFSTHLPFTFSLSLPLTLPPSLSSQGNNIRSAGPSTPVRLLGLRSLPTAGQELLSVANEAKARQIADRRQRTLALKEARY